MNARLRLAALLGIVWMTWCAHAPGARAAEMPVDSLMTEKLLHARLAAPDLTTLSWLRRQTDFAARAFGNHLGDNPPLIGVAAVATLPEARRPSIAALRVAGYDLVLAEPTDRVGVPPPGTADAAVAWASPGSERVARLFLRTYDRQKSPGNRRMPDWIESAVAGFSTLPPEQNLRLAWMHERIDQRIPLETFLGMSRPEAATKPARSLAKGAAAPSQRLFDAQALSFARFLGLYESERFIGKVLERAMAGEAPLSAFNIAKRLLPRPDALEKEWVAWVKAGAGKPPPK